MRSLFLFATDEDAGHRFVTQEKNNYAPNTAASLAYTVETRTIPLHNNIVITTSYINHLGESTSSVQDIINRQYADAEERAERNEAQKFLYDLRSARTHEGAKVPNGEQGGIFHLRPSAPSLSHFTPYFCISIFVEYTQLRHNRHP